MSNTISIMILGDSWGVPNYPPTQYIEDRIKDLKKYSTDIQIKFEHLGDPPETHTEFLLKDFGYNVINFSKNGGSNLDTIRAATSYLKNNCCKIDWIIWFHTESLRDRKEILTSSKVKFDIFDLSKKLAVMAYKEFFELTNLSNAKTIVIGGQAPVFVEEFIKICDHPKLLIEDWHSEILEITLPFSHGICNLDLFDHPSCINSIEEKNKMLNDIDTILKLDYESDNFPDNAHPGKRAHQTLSDKIHNLIKNNGNN
jgi:hypothetical protein